MPFVIEVPIASVVHRPTGMTYSRAELSLTITRGSNPGRSGRFLFDTGCAITTIDETIASILGLPPGGTPVGVTGATAAGVGRMVPVRFRFPAGVDSADATLTRSGLEVDSSWIVVPAGSKRIALLGFQDVHRHYTIWTDPGSIYLCRWADVTQLS